jgi:OmcA/MtrC family decaheme c-type cytochrome
MFRVGAGDDRETRVYFYGDFPASPFEPVVVTAEACTNCHGPEGIDIHGGYYQATDGGEPCLICHGSEREVIRDGVPVIEEVPRLASVAHGYHSSIESWGEDPTKPIEPHVTYPTYMNNCSVCHETEEQLTAVNAMPVIAPACFSCHGSTATMFDPTDPAYAIHEGLTSGCEACHAGQIGGIPQTVAQAHNGGITERDGVIWEGEDTSVTEGAKIVWEITDVADDGTDLTITWQASYEGVGVNPCNATAGPAAPVFFADVDADGDSLGNLSILRNYAQGQDYILGTNPNSAGQPGSSPGVDNSNTTCSGNVATTVVPVEETTAMYGRVAIQGKPRVPNVDPDPDPDFADEYGTLMPVRAVTPTYDWVIGEGGKAPDRRAVVDTTQCLKCHVGSLYQHGGNRVDNVDMCLLCHNTAANDQYVRVTNFGGVDASESYDGRAGQNFGMREMLHAVHSAGATTAPIVIYRGRGIYAWAGSEDQLNNWPTEDNCTRTNGSPGRTVVGSDPATATSDTCQPHTFHTPTYPRGLYDCAACHVEDDPDTSIDEGFAVLPDPTKAMASTVETGEDFGPGVVGQLDDVLEGITASSCMTCHRSGDTATENGLKAHAYQNGWVPQEFEEGRETIIEANQ